MEQEGFVQVEGGRIWYQVLGEGAYPWWCCTSAPIPGPSVLGRESLTPDNIQISLFGPVAGSLPGNGIAM